MSRRAFLARRNCGALMLCAASRPRAWHHPARRGREHRSGKCDSQQARAKQDKTGNGHREETVRGEFFAHGTPPTARKSDCQQDQLHTFAAIAGSHLPLRRSGESQVENIIRQSSISGPPRASLRLATCNRPFQISTETRTIEIDGSILRRYASDTERVSGESYGGLARAGERDLARSGSG
jgi:hypothetical protein